MALLRTKPGDLFYIPACDKNNEVGFVLGRHIDSEAGLRIIEVFSRFYKEPPSTLKDVDLTSRLFRPIVCSLEFYKQTISNKWRVLYSDEAYDRELSGWSSITISMPLTNVTGNFFKKGKGYSQKEESIEELEDSTIWMPINLSRRCSAYLSGIFEPNERYCVWKHAGIQNSPENREELNRFISADVDRTIAVCDAIYDRIEEWVKANKPKTKKVKQIL